MYPSNARHCSSRKLIKIQKTCGESYFLWIVQFIALYFELILNFDNFFLRIHRRTSQLDGLASFQTKKSSANFHCLFLLFGKWWNELKSSLFTTLWYSFTNSFDLKQTISSSQLFQSVFLLKISNKITKNEDFWQNFKTYADLNWMKWMVKNMVASWMFISHYLCSKWEHHRAVKSNNTFSFVSI